MATETHQERGYPVLALAVVGLLLVGILVAALGR